MRLVHMELFQGPKEQLHVFPRLRGTMPPDVGVLNSQREFYVIFNFIIRGRDKILDKKKNKRAEMWINWIFFLALPKGARDDPQNAHVMKCFDALINGNQKQRNHRIKFIPCVAEGPWIVKAAIGCAKDGTYKGATPTLVGEKVTTTYFQGEDYLEVSYNTAIDAVAVTSAKLSMQHSQKLVVDFGIVLQGESEEELPERILGVVRVSRFNVADAEIFPGTEKGTYRIDDDK